MRKLPGFPVFAADQTPPLARTAFLLTGDADLARALVVKSLTRVAARWSSVRWVSPAETARRELFALFLKHPRSGKDPQRRPGASGGGRDAASASQLAMALAALTPGQRALIVARHHDGAAEWQAADLCGFNLHTAQTETVVALSELRHRLPSLATASDLGTAPASQPGTAPASETGECAGPGSEVSTAPAPDNGVAPHIDSAGTSERTAAVRDGETSQGLLPWQAESSITDVKAPWAPPTDEPASPTSAPAFADPGQGRTEDRAGLARSAGSPAWGAPPGPGEDAWHAGLRRGLATLGAEMPAADIVDGVTAETLRAVRRRRAGRRGLVTSVSLMVTALILTPIAFGVAAVFGKIQESGGVADPFADPFADGDHGDSGNTPDPLPAVVGDPIRYAYHDFCAPGAHGPEDSDCEQWRVVTTRGDQWRIPDMDPDYSGLRSPLALSRDGNRMAYYSSSMSEFVVKDRHGSVPVSSHLTEGMDGPTGKAGLFISPSGRWLAADFGETDGAHRPRVHDFTTSRTWTLPKPMTIVALSDDGTVTATMTRDVTDVPGRIHATELVRMRPDGRVLSRVPADLTLFDSGAALSPDKTAVALSAERSHPAEGDHGLLVTMAPDTGRILSRVEASLPEDTSIQEVRGWASDHEAIVEAMTDTGEVGDEEYSVYAVDVRSGAAREIVLSDDGVPGQWAPGTLK
ncbi:hypothetical protein N5079_00755 [Planotetraspora sp. A-T 1434]|uniref:hypothetical protein n=1 Tax=Planotetraspora sp. A-T 1434 TaxID=2979219 RepID=UPI0021C00597|nr:hypothetical protein [Planotetraspora sp. A-T 1434]MCT9928740.1 hypothetical protein [Planotetraspora sp. A-T 1434]